MNCTQWLCICHKKDVIIIRMCWIQYCHIFETNKTNKNFSIEINIIIFVYDKYNIYKDKLFVPYEDLQVSL